MDGSLAAALTRAKREINQSLDVFFDYLINQGLAEKRLFLTGGRKSSNNITPLQLPIKPDHLLDFVQRCERDEVKLMALLGYFFSLRPQETLALTPKDFRAGVQAQAKECCKTMSKPTLSGGQFI